MNNLVQAAVVGCGQMAQHHLETMIQQIDTTQVIGLCDPSPAALEQARQKFVEAGLEVPPAWTALDEMLAAVGDRLDTVFIITPHAFHHNQTVACLDMGIDVLLEKPMAMNAAEARSLIDARDRTGRLLVVAFQGSLSPEIRTAVTMLRSGQLGKILTISATAWQGWKSFTANTWRQNPVLSGGGFMFDTGAHMLNTVTDLAGEDFAEVTAWFDQRSTEVDILATAMGRLKSGALVTLNGCGDAIDGYGSDVRVFCTNGTLQTGIWGGYLRLQRQGRKQLRRVKCPPSLGVWQQFLAVRCGQLENPSPPEVGLRLAYLWDALQESAARGGQPVSLQI